MLTAFEQGSYFFSSLLIWDSRKRHEKWMWKEVALTPWHAGFIEAGSVAKRAQRCQYIQGANTL